MISAEVDIMAVKSVSCLVTLLFLFTAVPAQATQNSAEIIQQVADTARLGLAAYLQKIPSGLEKNYGFESRSEFGRATLGRPYHQVGMDAADGSIEVIGTWRVPILVNGKSRAMLTVARLKGVWKVVEIGAAKMATDLGRLERDVIRGRPNLQVAIIRVFKLKSDFLAVAPAAAQIESGNFHPMLSAETLLKLERTASYSSQQLKTLLFQKLNNR
jgi:hypothetical protein